MSLWYLNFILVEAFFFFFQDLDDLQHYMLGGVFKCTSATQITSGLGWPFCPLRLVFIQATSLPFTQYRKPCSLTFHIPSPCFPDPLALRTFLDALLWVGFAYSLLWKALGCWTILGPCEEPQQADAALAPLWSWWEAHGTSCFLHHWPRSRRTHTCFSLSCRVLGPLLYPPASHQPCVPVGLTVNQHPLWAGLCLWGLTASSISLHLWASYRPEDSRSVMMHSLPSWSNHSIYPSSTLASLA